LWFSQAGGREREQRTSALAAGKAALACPACHGCGDGEAARERVAVCCEAR
jgi:hypothetical protein